MADTLLIQSYKDGPQPLWIEACLQSVKYLSRLKQWDYRFIGDELFKPLPYDFTVKIGNRGPILSDLGRLLAMKEALKSYRKVLWLDADTYLFNPSAFRLPEGSFGFGRERWVQPIKPKKKKNISISKDNPGWKIYRNVCNAFCYFERGNPFLDYYIFACKSIIHRADPLHIAPQMIGPKLLSALHSITNFPLTTSIGSASPDLVVDLYHQEGPALDFYRADLSNDLPEAGLNLCHSLLGTITYRSEPMSEEHLIHAIQTLYEQGKV